MTNQQPTDRQIQWLWEQCRLKLHKASDGELHWFDEQRDIVSSIDGDTGLPCIDLNNLFKYAPDIIVGIYFRYYPGGCECELTYITEAGFDIEKSWVKNETGDENKSRELSALALFWVIYKVFGK